MGEYETGCFEYKHEFVNKNDIAMRSVIQGV